MDFQEIWFCVVSEITDLKQWDHWARDFPFMSRVNFVETFSTPGYTHISPRRYRSKVDIALTNYFIFFVEHAVGHSRRVSLKKMWKRNYSQKQRETMFGANVNPLNLKQSKYSFEINKLISGSINESSTHASVPSIRITIFTINLNSSSSSSRLPFGWAENMWIVLLFTV